MRPVLAFPQCGQVTPFGQRISSKYARALSSSLKIGSVRLTVIAGVLSARYSTYCIPFVKGIIGLFVLVVAEVKGGCGAIAQRLRRRLYCCVCAGRGRR